MRPRYVCAALAAMFLVMFAGDAVVHADEFTAADVERWQGEYMSVVEKGRALWLDGDLDHEGADMVAIEAYVLYERRGVALAPGKH